MGFRRYGGDIETKGLGGRARLTWLAFPLGVFCGAFGFAVVGVIGLFIGVSICVVILLLANGTSRLPLNPVRVARFKYHYRHVKKYYRLGDMEGARESIV